MSGADGCISLDYASRGSACKNGHCACRSYEDGDEEDPWWEDVFGEAAKVKDLQLPEAATADQKKLQQAILAKERPPLKNCAPSPLASACVPPLPVICRPDSATPLICKGMSGSLAVCKANLPLMVSSIHKLPGNSGMLGFPSRQR